MASDSANPDMSEFLDPSGHPPVFSKKRKAKKDNQRPGGVSVLQSMFSPPQGEVPATPPTFQEQAFELPLRPAPPDPEGGKQSVTPDPNDPPPPIEYSNEARVYHCKYAELSEAHDKYRYEYCREGCLNLLTEPNLPRYTRIQTLQMVSTLVKPVDAADCLEEAGQILDEMDQSKFQVRLLREDNENMKADLQVWRGKKGARGEVVEGPDEHEGGEPHPDWFAFDRDVAQKVHQEVQEELEPFGNILPSPHKQEEAVDGGTGLVGVPQSPYGESDTGLLSPSEDSE